MKISRRSGLLGLLGVAVTGCTPSPAPGTAVPIQPSAGDSSTPSQTLTPTQSASPTGSASASAGPTSTATPSAAASGAPGGATAGSSGTGAAPGTTGTSTTGTTTQATSTTTTTSTAPQPVAGVINVLCVGSDSRTSGSDSGNADALILAQLSGSTLALVSIPRDSYVTIAGGSKNRINSAMETTGMSGLIQTVSDMFGGLPIRGALRTNFDDFIRLVGVFGGVSVANRISSYTSVRTGGVANFPAGTIDISGEKALAFVRQRYRLPRGDLDRTERHRAVIRAMVRAAQSSGSASSLARNAFNYVRGTGISSSSASDMVGKLSSISSIVSVMVPVSGFGNAGGLTDLTFVDSGGLSSLGAALRAGNISAYSG